MKIKLGIISVIIFTVAAIAATLWYISLHSAQDYNVQDITKTFLQVGLISACITTLFFLLIYLSIKNVKDKGFRFFLISIIIIFFLAFVWQLTLNMVFYQMDSPQSFVKYFLEL